MINERHPFNAISSLTSRHGATSAGPQVRLPLPPSVMMSLPVCGAPAIRENRELMWNLCEVSSNVPQNQQELEDGC